MTLRRAILLVWVGLLTAIGAAVGAENAEDVIWDGNEQRYTGRRPFDLNDEEIARILKRISESNPKKAEELEELRKTDQEKFLTELKDHGGEEFGKIINEKIENYRQRRRDEFLEWFDKNYHDRAEELKNIKTNDPNSYNKRYESIWITYRRIYEARWNEELVKVLKQDLHLKFRRDELIAKIKGEKDDNKRKELAGQLKNVVNDRFDLIVRRKQIAYEELLKRLADLQKQIEDQNDEIKKWREEKFRDDNVRSRMDYLLKGIPKFKWD
ncbi:MAG: hypothetical protein JW720_12595 [Sedimentisphaerales bacterium]|nr:hypothetical protein [Sedimentisphaerales bacterium]